MRILKENNEQANGLLSCSECGAKDYQNLTSHITRVHKMTIQDYKKKYPEDKIYLDELIANFSKGGYAANQVMKDNNFDFSKRAKKARETELENDPDTYLKRNRKLYQNPEFKARAIQRIMNVQTFHRDRYRYKDLSLRSSWEQKLAEWFDSQGIQYQYEALKIKYFDPIRETERVYFPDFYLPDKNLVVEVKPRCYLDSPDIQAKKLACESEGYKFIFITQEELNNLSTDLFNV